MVNLGGRLLEVIVLEVVILVIRRQGIEIKPRREERAPDGNEPAEFGIGESVPTTVFVSTVVLLAFVVVVFITAALCVLVFVFPGCTYGSLGSNGRRAERGRVEDGEESVRLLLLPLLLLLLVLLVLLPPPLLVPNSIFSGGHV